MVSEFLPIGDMARRAGVSVRTLRFYEQRGLITATRSEGGRRNFPRREVEKVQQILLLKTIGLRLDDIAELMHKEGVDAGQFLDMQTAALAEQKQRIEALLAQLETARQAIRERQDLDIASLCELIESTRRLKMEEDWKDVIEQYYTEEQLADLASRAPTAEEQEQITARWNAVMARMNALAEANADPAGPEAQDAAREWQDLIDAFTGGDPGIFESLRRMIDDRQNWPKQPMPQEDMAPPEAASEFVQKALAIYNKARPNAPSA